MTCSCKSHCSAWRSGLARPRTCVSARSVEALVRIPTMSDARNMLQHHYRDASRLDARIRLHAEYSTNTQGFHSWVFEHLRLPPTCQVLEVGCGSGQLWLANHDRLPAGWNVTLADLSPGMLTTAHHQLSPRGHAFQFVVHD